MFKVKHFLEAVDSDDGRRLWVEPIGVTRDLQELCRIDQVLDHLGPPRALWDWFEEHPQGYEFFRARYHTALETTQHRDALEQLVKLAQQENVTLLHQSDNPNENTAAALHEFLGALRPFTPEQQ